MASLLLHWCYAMLIFVIRGLSHWVLSLGGLNSTFRYFQSWSSERRLLVNSSLIPPSPLSKVCDQSAAVLEAKVVEVVYIVSLQESLTPDQQLKEVSHAWH